MQKVRADVQIGSYHVCEKSILMNDPIYIAGQKMDTAV